MISTMDAGYSLSDDMAPGAQAGRSSLPGRLVRGSSLIGMPALDFFGECLKELSGFPGVVDFCLECFQKRFAVRVFYLFPEQLYFFLPVVFHLLRPFAEGITGLAPKAGGGFSEPV